jgi:hypothetical protein
MKKLTVEVRVVVVAAGEVANDVPVVVAAGEVANNVPVVWKMSRSNFITADSDTGSCRLLISDSDAVPISTIGHFIFIVYSCHGSTHLQAVAPLFYFWPLASCHCPNRYIFL